jgi:hypothetical protein
MRFLFSELKKRTKEEKNKKRGKYSCDSNSDKHAIKKRKKSTAETDQYHHHDRQNTFHVIDLFYELRKQE